MSGCRPVSAIVAGGAGGSGWACDRVTHRREDGAHRLASLGQLDAMTDLGAGRGERAGGQLEHAGGAAARQADPPRLQRRHAVDHHAALVERDHVDGEAHPPGVHAAARHDPQAFAGVQAAAVQQPHGAGRAGVGDRHVVGDDGSGIQVPRDECHDESRRPNRYFVFSTSGIRTVTNRIAAGPIVTTQIAGKMQKTSGNTIFTPVFAAASSARWRRLVRSVSE